MNLYDNTSGHLPGDNGDPNAPWNQADEQDEVMFGETEVTVNGMDYFVLIDHGMGFVQFSNDETCQDLQGKIPKDLFDHIVDVAKEKLSKH